MPARAGGDIADGTLVLRARGGDRWARDALVSRHLPALANLAARLLGNLADAEDVAHDAVVEAITTLDKLRDPEAFRPWLLRIAVFLVHRRWRRRRLLATFGLDRSPPDATLESCASPDAGPEVRAELGRLDAALARLPAADRVAWMLRAVEEHSLEEVADACACSLATAKRRIARADAFVRAHAVVAAETEAEGGEADV